MTVALLCTALLGALIFGLGLGVSLNRQSSKIGIGSPPDPNHPLGKLVRAHGNAAEYGPILAVLMIAIASQGASTWMLWLFVIVTAARYMHAAGMILSADLNLPHPLRFTGSLLTYLGGFLLSLALLLVI
ncbi:MAG: MAPEG family protein [Candidatus Binatia bacterium]